MLLSRRQLLAGAAAASLASARQTQARSLDGLKIGVTDWNLRLTGKLEALRLAASLGFEGVEVSLGREPDGDRLAMDNHDLQQQHLAEARKQGIALAGTCLNILHRNYLKNDKLAQKWVADGIAVTKALNAKVMLLPFFGKGALETRREIDYVGDILRELAPEAEKAGVILSPENTISAEDNVRLMDRSRSPAVLTYYDVGNSTLAGFYIIKEIRWLGAARIAQFHLKDNPNYMGEGKIDFAAVMDAIADLDFKGFANLETNSPSKSVADDMRRNLAYTRTVLEEAQQT